MKLRRKKPGARVEMLPLMDIVFLLLVFFIYAMLSMAVHRGMRLNLPESSSAELDVDSVLAVSLTEDGSLFLDKEPVALDELAALLRLKSAEEDGPDALRVQVFAAGTVSYQELYQVLDCIKEAGINKISLQAQQIRADGVEWPDAASPDSTPAGSSPAAGNVLGQEPSL